MKNNYNTRLGLLVFTFLCSFLSWGQTNPTAQALPYSFNSLTGTTLPAGMAVPRFGTSAGAIPLTRTTIVATGDLPNGTGGAAGWGPETANGISLLASGSQSAGAIVVSINTTGNTNISVQWLSGTILQQASRDNSIALQYRVGTSGVWTDVGTTTTYTSQGKTAGDISATLSEVLPAAAENQAIVQLRWVYWESNGAAGSRDRLNIDNISVTGTTSSNTIATSAIAGSPYCVSASTSASVSVPFTSVGTFNAGNIYTAQLSNAAGNFASPVSIGTVTSVLNTDVISATIPAGTAAGTGYRIRVVSNNPVVTGSENTVNLTVQNAAAITAQPSTTVQNICQSAAATALSVTATGSTLSYQWYSNTSNTNSGGTAVGTNSASYTPVTTAVGTLYYYCVVTAACGAPVTSNVSGAVNVTSVPSAPSGTINVSANPSCGAAILSYSAPNATIYWQTSATGVLTTNPTTSNYTSSATAGSYTIYVRELSGTCWSPATSVTFTVTAPVAISVQPTNQSTTIGNTATFTVTASNAASYQWQVNTGSGFVNIGTNSNTYTTPATTLAMSGYTYQVIISGNAPCGTVTSSVATLNVTTGPCLAANFESGNPAGWLINGTILGGQFCEGTQGLVFNNTGDNVITTAITNPQTLTFSKKRSGTADAWILDIEVSTSNAGPWTNVTTINTITATCQTETVDLSAYMSGTYFIRFIDNRASGTAQRTIDDIQVFCGTPCTPATIVATPSSGPVGTEVTITATTGSLTGATASFGAINATVVSNTGTQMVVLVPNGATTGVIKITDAQPCDAVTAFTVISLDNTSCEGIAATTDLIIYDIHDEQTGSGGFITLYNGTAATVNLINYTLWRTSVHDDGAEIDYANLTGTIAPGALGILKVSVGSCGPASTNGTIDGGFNENDGIQLRNAAGTVIVDDVDTYPTGPGYYMVRNAGALSARTSYVAADWSTIPLGAGVCYPSAGLTLPSGTAVAPLVTAHPTYSPSCGTTSAVLNTAGTEGFAGGLTLAYQWYFAAPGSASWTAVTDGGIYSGATTASLTISAVTGVVNYQYYCQIRENSATCYSASNAVKITDTNATTWNGLAWSNGLPSLTKAAIIDGTYVTSTHGDFSCCSLTVNATRTLTISSGGYVEVQNNITNNGTLDVLSNGSLVQISDAGVNTGNIRYNRTTSIRRQDYVYWSAPVAGFANSAVSPGTNLGYQYKWLPTTGGINNFGNWTLSNETMVLGKGYCLRGPDSYPLATITNYTATFVGVPNNGVITLPISRGTWNGGTYSTGVSSTLGTNEDDNWNLVGNPYPSAIHAINFLTLNPNIDGFVNIWTHGTLPSSAITDPFYNDYAYNYTPGDYITYNAAGTSSGPGAFNGRIAGGQGFFVSMLPTTGATTENLIFNNSLRNIAHNNGQFFRSSSATSSVGDSEKHRIWLDLVTPTGTSFRSLIGYIEGATNGKDRLFDAFSNEKLTFHIFSLIEDEKMLIQGKTLPFDDTDKVRIGVTLPQNGSYKIALGALDGLFSNPSQNIYLEDKLLHVIHDLRTAPYTFTENSGTIKDRFVIRYNNSLVLANESFDATNDVIVVSNQELNVTSTKEKIANIIVFDVLGRKLFESKNVNATQFTLPVHKRNAPLFIEIDLENGIKVNKKTVY